MESRTTKGLYNSAVALAIYFINLILGFVSRRVFIDNLGAEVLGLNTTVSSILQFLNLAELGIGSAVACLLYKPLFDDDKQKVKEIVALQGWLYRYIAIGLIVVSLVVMAFFPILFKKIDLPLWYAYASFLVLLFSALLSYFVNFKQIVLSANQQEYKINFSYKISVSAKILFQILAIAYFTNGYIWWLILEVLFTIIASVVLNYQIYKTFPFLRGKIKSPDLLRKKYPEVIIKIKQLFCHKIGSFVLSQSSPLVIYAFTTLTIVTIYGNYMLIIVGFGMLLTAIYNGLGASVGNLVAEGNEKNISIVFKELFTSRFLLLSTCSFLIYNLATPFVILWVGKEYILSQRTVLLITLIFYLNNERLTTHSFINAYGLFGDVIAPLIEAIINISTSIILGYYFGLNGILTGVIISLFIIPFCWKPYYLYSRGFKRSINSYIWMYGKHISYLVITICIYHCISKFINIIEPYNYTSLILNGIMMTFFFGSILFLIQYIFEPSMRIFTTRILRLIKL